jgi:inorganic triphosphatase YgiF
MPDQETELKFALAPGDVDRLQQALMLRARSKTPARAQTLHSTYYDTPDRALQSAGFSLRVRAVGPQWVQTVKQEAACVASRGEWEIALKDGELDLKAAASTPLGDILRDLRGAPAPVFTTTVQRTTCLIRQGSAKVEAAMDRGVIQAQGRTAEVCELELELKAGPVKAVFDLARRLSDTAPLRLSFESKSQRGYGLLDDPPRSPGLKGDAVRLTRTMSVRAAFQAIAADALKQWVGNAASLRAHRQPEALHQMRVALRRLRTALKLFEAVVSDDAYPKLMTDLTWLTGELDQGRDTDVLIDETFRPAAERFAGQAGLASLGERLLATRAKTYDRILAVLDGPRHLALVLEMAAWIDAGRWVRPDDPKFAPKADAPIDALAAEALDRLRRQIKRRSRGLRRLDAPSRHKLRIRAKRLRYALEFFADLYVRQPKARDRFLRTLRLLQDALGALNDLHVARQAGLALAEGGGRAAGESEIEGAQQAFAAGLMIGARAQDEASLMQAAETHYKSLIAAKPFWRN